jgi:hypothetical protein
VATTAVSKTCHNCASCQPIANDKNTDFPQSPVTAPHPALS